MDRHFTHKSFIAFDLSWIEIDPGLRSAPDSTARSGNRLDNRFRATLRWAAVGSLIKG
jgi:hypothetical protein